MEQNSTWKGYSFKELQYQRALATIKCEIEKEKINTIITKFKQDKLSIFGIIKGVPKTSKMIGPLNIVDYSLAAFRIGRKILSIFRNIKSK